MASVGHAACLREVVSYSLVLETFIKGIVDGQIGLVADQGVVVVAQDFLLRQGLGEEAELIQTASETEG